MLGQEVYVIVIPGSLNTFWPTDKKKGGVLEALASVGLAGGLSDHQKTVISHQEVLKQHKNDFYSYTTNSRIGQISLTAGLQNNHYLALALAASSVPDNFCHIPQLHLPALVASV